MKTKTLKLTLLPVAAFLLLGLSGCKNKDNVTITVYDIDGLKLLEFEQTKKLPVTKNKLENLGLTYEDAEESRIFNHFFYDQDCTEIVLSDTLFTEDVSLFAHYIDARYSALSQTDGDDFRSAFKRYNSNIINPRTYSSVTTFIKANDTAIDNPSKLECIYDHSLWAPSQGPVASGVNGWNREHVWPQSKLRIPGVPYPKDPPVGIRTDVINIRACDSKVNEEASNNFLGDASKYDKPVKLDLPEYDRPEVARILFYMESAYGLELYDVVNDKAVDSNIAFGNLPDLIEWWLEDPEPTAFEVRRQDAIETFQNNRNPFVDEPKLAYSVFDMVELKSIH